MVRVKEIWEKIGERYNKGERRRQGERRRGVIWVEECRRMQC